MSYEYPPGSASGRYEAMTTDRDPWLRKAREYALFTMPSLFPPEGSHGEELTPGYQSTGSRGVKNLASKLLLALMPPNIPFYRYNLDAIDKKELAEDEAAWADIQLTLNRLERLGYEWLEATHVRVTAYEALLNLLVGGNVLFRLPKDGQSRIYPLSQYVIRRSTDGSVKEIIIKEEVSKWDIPSEIIEEYGVGMEMEEPQYGVGKNTVCIYTCYKLRDNTWYLTQEIKGREIDDPRYKGTAPKDAPEYIPMRWRKIDNSDYGNGFVEDLIGDLRSFEGLSQSITEGAAGISKLLFMVNPNGNTNKEDLEKPNLSVIDGKAEDVTALQAGKSMDLSFAKQHADSLDRALQIQFLLNTAVQRNAERVTAEEIRYVAQELENTLGGQYSLLSLEFQVPIVRRTEVILRSQGKFPQNLPPPIKLKIIAGLDALGRGHELNNLEGFVKDIETTFGQGSAERYINVDDYLKKVAAARGIETMGLVKTPEERQAEAQAQQQAQINQSVAPEAARAAFAEPATGQPTQ